MHHETEYVLQAVLRGDELSESTAMTLAEYNDLPSLLSTASQLRDAVHSNRISYSRKAFISLTQLCRDVCHYCTFAHPPVRGQAAYLKRDEVLAIAKAGAEAGCKEALFTLGDKPERRYKIARQELAALGHETTLYKSAPEKLKAASFKADELQPIVLTPNKHYARSGKVQA